MSPMLITLNVLGTLAMVVMAFAVGGVWVWVLVGTVLADLLTAWMKKKAAERERAAAAYQVPAPYNPPVTHSVETTPPPVQKKEPASDTLPTRIGDTYSVYRYPDVTFTGYPKGMPYARAKAPADLRSEGGKAILSQDGHDIGEINSEPITEMVSDWARNGEPVRAVVRVAPFPGRPGQALVVFYRDTLTRARRNQKAFSCRLAAPEDWFGEEQIGIPLRAELEDGLYVLAEKEAGLTFGHLPASALHKLEELDTEPEDAAYYLESVDYDVENDRTVCHVLVVP